MSETSDKVTRAVLEEGRKLAAKAVIYAAIAGGLMLVEPLRERVTAIWNSPAALDHIFHEVREMRDSLRRVTGEDRVIRQTPGQSYVVEPVTWGTTVVMNVVVQRTTLGATCRLLRRTGVFTDRNGVAYAGLTVEPSRQIGVTPDRVRIEMEHPRALPPGRTEVYLALEYNCAGVTVFDRTDNMVFTLLEAPR